MSLPRTPQLDSLSTIYTGHLRFGWWSLVLYAAIGLGLESLHAFKIGGYLNASNETRRLMWTLAHAHGALLSLVNVAFALSAQQFPFRTPPAIRTVSRSLIVATVTLPLGFFLGGVRVYGGDPSAAILLVPLGAVALIVALVVTAMQCGPPGPAASKLRSPAHSAEGGGKTARVSD
jgi:hypothetical protein